MLRVKCEQPALKVSTLRFKGECIQVQHAQVLLTCQLGTTRHNKNGGNEYIYINNIRTS